MNHFYAALSGETTGRFWPLREIRFLAAASILLLCVPCFAADIDIDVDTAIELVVNKVPLAASADGYTIDETIAYNESGMDLNWNFVTTAGVVSQTNVTPTTAGDYDWSHVGNGIYKIEMTATGGASANNDTEGFGWWSGVADAILPFTSPVYRFRAAALNNADTDGGDVMDVNVTTIEDTDATDALDTAANTVTVTSIGNNVITTASINDGAITDAKVANDVQVDVLTIETGDATDAIGTAQTGDSYALAAGANGFAAIKTETATIVADTNELQTDDIPGAIAALNNFDPALDIVANVALVDVTTTNTDMRGTDSAYTGTPPTAVAIRQEVDSNSTQLAAIVGDTNELQTNQGDWATATGFSTHSAADVWAVATRTLTAATNLSIPSAADNADAVWNEAIADHAGAGSTGATLSAASAPSAASVADAVWEETIADHSGTSGSTAEQLAAAGAGGDPWATPLPGSYTTGQAGNLIGNLLASIDQNVDAMLGTGFNEDVHSIPAIVSRFPQGDGVVEITEDYGGTGALGAYEDDAKTIGIPDVNIRVYLKSAYDAGGRIQLATTTTDATGGFSDHPMWLDAGTYRAVYEHPDYDSTYVEFTVTE